MPTFPSVTSFEVTCSGSFLPPPSFFSCFSNHICLLGQLYFYTFQRQLSKERLFQEGESLVTNMIHQSELPLTSQEKHFFSNYINFMLLTAVKYLLSLKCFFRKTLLIAFTSVLCLSEVTILTKIKVKAARTHLSFLVKGNKHTVLPVAGDGHRTRAGCCSHQSFKKSMHANSEEAKMTFAYSISALKGYCLNNELSSDLTAQK